MKVSVELSNAELRDLLLSWVRAKSPLLEITKVTFNWDIHRDAPGDGPPTAIGVRIEAEGNS